MITINADDPALVGDPNAIAVKNSKLAITTLPTDYGTFAVSTDDDFNRLPYNRASAFRITNLTGKLVGVRRRHDTVVSDNFESGDFSRWTGTATAERATDDLEGAYSLHAKDGYLSAPIGAGTLGDGSVVEISFKTMHHDTFVGLFDSAVNVPLIEAMATGATVGFKTDGSISTTPSDSASSATWEQGKEYRLEIEVIPSTQKFNAHLFHGNARQEIVQNGDASNSGGLTGTLENYVIGVSGDSVIVDSVVVRKAAAHPNEILTTGSTYVYPCLRSISEYEIANLGSDAQNYVDASTSITLTGFYSV